MGNISVKCLDMKLQLLAVKCCREQKYAQHFKDKYIFFSVSRGNL